ncbi:1-phosphofructokinase family hexose kinase [Flavihumibacter fluvii]|uniref:1-phosphofructokinase family hexose kinase n=1 Tax=Flavihumibacter fluvii TaxID=2838157 RepID=UPI001BDE62EB|nr:hexose kinase [Flavihumibacter fluvii]ULQ53816.1 hexose kinase [Flavihumibacter fluvii]
MPNLVTITFSPCIDKSVTVPVLLPEKKLHCTEPILEPGGGGINIARAINKLGYSATAIYPAGGCTGAQFSSILATEHVPVIVIESKYEMRVNLNVLNEATNLQYRFIMPGIELLPGEWQACLNAIDSIKDPSYIIVSGSLPPGVPIDIFHQIAGIARQKKARLIVDTSREALLQLKDCGVFLLKPNLSELSMLAGRNEIHLEQIESVAREVIANGYCEMMVVSIGSTGAMLVTKDKVFRAIPPAVKIKGTVGAGDSMVAGLVISLNLGKSFEDTIRYAVACGTAACLNAGTALCNQQDVERLLSLTRVFNA